MDSLPASWSALAVVVFLLGLKHGFDADHLATLDGLTRVNARARRPFARWCGALFSLGMLVTDALIGLWISRLIARTDGRELLSGAAVVTVVLMSYILGKRLAHERPVHD